jgi:hypothetical protein
LEDESQSHREASPEPVLCQPQVEPSAAPMRQRISKLSEAVTPVARTAEI